MHNSIAIKSTTRSGNITTISGNHLSGELLILALTIFGKMVKYL